jgi:hypothetical protein
MIHEPGPSLKRKVLEHAMKITRVPLTPLDAMFTGTPFAYTPGATTIAAIRAARQGELTTVGSVDAPLTELNALDDNAPAPQGGRLFSELVREYLKDREGEPPIEPGDKTA